MITSIKLSKIQRIQFFWALRRPFTKKAKFFRLKPLFRGTNTRNIVLYPRKLYKKIRKFSRREKKKRRRKRRKKRVTIAKTGPRRVKYFKNFFRTKKKGIKGLHSHTNLLNTPIFAKSTMLVKTKWQEHARLIFKKGHGRRRRVRRRRNRKTRIAQRKGKRKNRYLRLNIFPSISLTKKPLHTRMGKGKGKPIGFIGLANPDRPIFEISSLTSARFIKLFIKKLNYRSPIFFKQKNKKRILFKRVHQALFPEIENSN